MPRSKTKARRRDPLPENFGSLEAFWSFWDKHSTTDYEDLMEDVDVDVDVNSSRVYCPVSRDIMHQARRQARRLGVSTETLINLWLQEKVAEASHSR